MVLLECACIVCLLGKMIQAPWLQCVIAHPTLFPSWARHFLKTGIHYTYCTAEKQRKFLSSDWPTVSRSLPSTQLLMRCPLHYGDPGWSSCTSLSRAHMHTHTHMQTHTHTPLTTHTAFAVTCGVCLCGIHHKNHPLDWAASQPVLEGPR